MKTSIYKYKTLFLILFGFLSTYQLAGYVQKPTNSFSSFQEIKFCCNCENDEAFVSFIGGQSDIPKHKLNNKAGIPHYFVVYDISNYTKSDAVERDLTEINFSKVELNSLLEKFYTNLESISQKLPFEKALHTDILLI